MKPRDFHLRLDQTPGANLQRFSAYIRSLQPNVKPVPKMKARANLRAMLRRVK